MQNDRERTWVRLTPEPDAVKLKSMFRTRGTRLLVSSLGAVAVMLAVLTAAFGHNKVGASGFVDGVLGSIVICHSEPGSDQGSPAGGDEHSCPMCLAAVFLLAALTWLCWLAAPLASVAKFPSAHFLRFAPLGLAIGGIGSRAPPALV